MNEIKKNNNSNVSETIDRPFIQPSNNNIAGLWVCNGKGVIGNLAYGKKFVSSDAVEKEIKTTTTYNSFITFDVDEFFKKKFSSTTLQFYTYAEAKLREQNNINIITLDTINNVIKIRISEYQKLKKLKNYKAIKEQMLSDLKLLYSINMEWYEPNYYKKSKSYYKKHAMRIIYKIEEDIKNGIITFTFTPDWAFYVLSSKMNKQMPLLYWELQNIAADLFYRLISSQRKNKKKNGNQIDTIFIKAEELTKGINSLRRYEDVIKSRDRHVFKRIINPVVQNMNELVNRGVLNFWELLDKSGKKIDDGLNSCKQQNYEKLKWNVFKNCYIKVQFKTFISIG